MSAEVEIIPAAGLRRAAPLPVVYAVVHGYENTDGEWDCQMWAFRRRESAERFMRGFLSPDGNGVADKWRLVKEATERRELEGVLAMLRGGFTVYSTEKDEYLVCLEREVA